MKRVLSWTLAFVMVAMLFPTITTSKTQAISISNGKFLKAIEAPVWGSIPISNRAELDAIRNDLNGRYHLVADIDLSDGLWQPIAGEGVLGIDSFRGVFDGQGYSIRNLTIQSASRRQNFAGLFGYLSDNAEVKNLALEDVNIDIHYVGSVYVGAISGSGGIISNSYSSGLVSVTQLRAQYEVVMGSGPARVGGISGSGSTITNCYNDAIISINITNSTDDAYAGGISGVNSNISHSYNTGTVSANISDGSDAVYAGGITGKDSNISYSFNTGTVTATRTGGGYGNWYRAYSIAGGICGSNGNGYNITESYNTGYVISSTPDSNESFAGGVLGYSAVGSTVSNSFYNIDSLIVLDGVTLANAEKKGLGHGIGQATGLTSTQMQSQSSFTGWDFNSVWVIVPSLNNGFPVLRAFHNAPVEAPPDEHLEPPVEPQTEPPTEPSLDAPSPWAESQVNRAISAELVPNSLQRNYLRATTRAEFAALAVTLYELVTGTSIDYTGRTFTDTNDVNALKAAAIGVTTGTGDGTTFNPDFALPREQAATMLSRLASAIGSPLPSHAAAFSDINNASAFAHEAIGQMEATGIMGSASVTEYVFLPKDPYTREQSIVTMMRLYDYVRN